MAFNKKLTVQVIVRNVGSSKVEQSKTSKITKKNTPKQSLSTTNNNKSKNMIKSVLKGTTAVVTAKEAVDTVIDLAMYQLEYSLKAEANYQGQLNVNRAKSVIGTAISSGTKVLGAFVVGGPVLGAITLIGQGAKLGIDAYKARNEQQYKIDQQNVELSFNRVRAGYAYSDNSIGGDR